MLNPEELDSHCLQTAQGWSFCRLKGGSKLSLAPLVVGMGLSVLLDQGRAAGGKQLWGVNGDSPGAFLWGSPIQWAW